MEQAGVKLDTEQLRRSPTRVKAEADELEREIFELAGEEFTLGSPKQLEEILFGKLGLSRKRRGKTGYSTDARVLQAIRAEHEIIPKIERWRELTKLAQTYLDALPLLVDSASRLHTTFNQTAATTGRLSSNNPNLQNIPIRTAARARDPRVLRRRARATCSCRPTTPRSSCGCSPTSPARTCSRRSSAAARTSTPPPPAACSASRRTRSTPGCARSPR